MRNNNLLAKTMLFIILGLGVVFEFANHFHLTYLFMNAKLEAIVGMQLWIIKAVSVFGALFFITCIVGFGIIGYKFASWISALLTIAVSYISYNLMPEALLKAEIMQVGTFEFSVVLPIAVAFTTHELSKFLNLKTISKLSLKDSIEIEEQERELEKLQKQIELAERKKQLTPTLSQNASVSQSNTVVQQNTAGVSNLKDPYQEAFEKFGLNGTPVPHKNGNSVHNQVGFKLNGSSVENIKKENGRRVILANQGFKGTCLYCGEEFYSKRENTKFCPDKSCKNDFHNQKGGKVDI